MAKKPEPPKLFWLSYRYSDGRAAGVVVIESHGLLHARLKASLAGADRGLEFASGHQLDRESAGQIPANMIGRFLDDGVAAALACGLRVVTTVGASGGLPALAVEKLRRRGHATYLHFDNSL
jgi:hypothetical protein